MKRIVLFICMYSYWFVSIIFVSLLATIVIVDKEAINEHLVEFIYYSFWYSFGLFSGFLIIKYILKYLNKHNIQAKKPVGFN